VAGSIRDLARRPSDIVCRYGSEEIVVVLGSTGLAPALAIAEQMRAAVASPQIPYQGSACADHVTVSIGVAAAIARAGGSMNMPEGLLQAADHALYKAKSGGRNRVEQAILIGPSDQ
jgi:diguanylate cyclase (GGDEF)-like protein